MLCEHSQPVGPQLSTVVPSELQLVHITLPAPQAAGNACETQLVPWQQPVQPVAGPQVQMRGVPVQTSPTQVSHVTPF